MTITLDFKEVMNDLNEKYFKVVHLLRDDAKPDPPDDPHLSKNTARQIMFPMKATIEDLLKNQVPNSPEQKKLTGMLASVEIFLGTICIETGEYSDGESHLEKCFEVVEDFKEDPEFVSIMMNAHNQWGILKFYNDIDKAKTSLCKSVEMYEQNKNNIDPPKSLDNFFETDPKDANVEELWLKFEKIHTATLYFLAQVYSKLKDNLKSAVYCHRTLKRQLIYKQHEPLDWALNAATLSQFFAEQNGFKQARHHLRAASCILDEYKQELDEIEVHDEVYEAKIEEFEHWCADVARCWTQYGLVLLSKSKERLRAEANTSTFSDLSDLDFSKLSVSKEDISDLFFPSLNGTNYENQVTDKYVLTLGDAKAVFLNAQSWLVKSQKYYALETLASDYIDITLNHSDLYESLLFFEEKAEIRAKYQKRRIDLLEKVLEKVNPQYYLSHCRKMWYDAGHIYVDMLEIKLDIERESKDLFPTPHSLSKINNIVNKGIMHYNSFVKSFEGKDITPDFYQLYAKAHFFVGVLYGKYITLDKKLRIEKIEASLQAYQAVLNFCEKYEQAIDTVKLEYDVCKEMVELLPIRLDKMKARLIST